VGSHVGLDPGCDPDFSLCWPVVPTLQDQSLPSVVHGHGRRRFSCEFTVAKRGIATFVPRLGVSG